MENAGNFFLVAGSDNGVGDNRKDGGGGVPYGFVAHVAHPARQISGLSDQGCHVGVLRIVERRLGLRFHARRVHQQLVSRSALADVSIHVYRSIT